ncbi:unnamed protein product, partial [Amoebophrya sp. A25]
FKVIDGASEAQLHQLNTLKELLAHGTKDFWGEDAFQRDLLLLEIRELEKNIFLEIALTLHPRAELLPSKAKDAAGGEELQLVRGAFPEYVIPDVDPTKQSAADLRAQGWRSMRRLQLLYREMDIFEPTSAEAERVQMIRELSEVFASVPSFDDVVSIDELTAEQLHKLGSTADELRDEVDERSKVRYLVENLMREHIQELETEVLIAWGHEVLLRERENDPDISDAVETAGEKSVKTDGAVALGAAKRRSSFQVSEASQVGKSESAPKTWFAASSFYSRQSTGFPKEEVNNCTEISQIFDPETLVVQRCLLPNSEIEAQLFSAAAPSENQTSKSVAIESLENLQLALVKYEGAPGARGSFGPAVTGAVARANAESSNLLMLEDLGALNATQRLFASTREFQLLTNAIGGGAPSLLPGVSSAGATLNPSIAALRRALIEQKRELETDVVLESMERRRRTLLAIKDGPVDEEDAPDFGESRKPRASQADSALARLGETAVKRIETMAVEVAETNFGLVEAENQVAKADSLATAHRYVEHIYELCDSELPASSVEVDPKTHEVTLRLNRAAMAQVQHLEADALLGLTQKILENQATWRTTARKTLSARGETLELENGQKMLPNSSRATARRGSTGQARSSGQATSTSSMVQAR